MNPEPGGRRTDRSGPIGSQPDGRTREGSAPDRPESLARRRIDDLAEPSRALLFDLDGTLVDTRHDLHAGVAGLFAERDLAPPSLELVVGRVGHGIRTLVLRCLEDSGKPVRDDDDAEEAVRQFRHHYSEHLLDQTRPYPGIEEALHTLAKSGRPMAVVSNKAEDFTRRIVEGLGLAGCFGAVVGGDTLPVKKPDPAPLLRGLDLLLGAGASRQRSAYFGDSILDADAARSAGMPFCGVAWGYNPDGRLNEALCDWWFADPRELARALTGSG